MNHRFDDLWTTAPDDGAMCPVGVSAPSEARHDADELLDAWYRERSASIELSLLVEQARLLLSRMLDDDELSPARRKQAHRLLREIRKGPRGAE
jgi:hypothetical protein